MTCPACNTVALQMTERSGIEIDYCPQCRGVWLDRGELDKIIERSSREVAAPMAPPQPRYEDRRSDDRDYRKYDDDDYKYKKRKKSFFEELFD